MFWWWNNYPNFPSSEPLAHVCSLFELFLSTHWPFGDELWLDWCKAHHARTQCQVCLIAIYFCQLIQYLIYIFHFCNSYTCLWPKKYVISKDDLANLNAANIKKSINTTCLATGVYNIDMTNYVCTKPCPIPISPNPSLMYHNWTNTTQVLLIHFRLQMPFAHY